MVLSGVQDEGESRLLCRYTNLRSILNKREEMGILMGCSNLDIVAITESWAHSDVDDVELCFPGFNMFRKDRIRGDKKRGGGILLYIRDTLTAIRLEEDDTISETLWVKLLGNIDGAKDIVIGVCYESPSATNDEVIKMHTLVRKYSISTALILGDFNHGDINWKTGDAGAKGRKFLNMVDDCFLRQLVKGNTRGGNILDLIFTNEPGLIEDVEITAPVASSDHNLITFRMLWVGGKIMKECQSFSYHKGNYEGIRKKLSGVNWDDMFAGLSVDDMWQCFWRELISNRDKFIPKCKLAGRKFPPWMKFKIRKEIKARNKAWSNFNKVPTYQNKEKYRKLRNYVNKEIRGVKREFEYKLASRIKDDPKSFYAYVKSKSRGTSKVGPLLDEKGRLVEDSIGISRVLNDFFASVFTREKLDDIPEAKNRVLDGSVKILSSIDITPELVTGHIKSLKRNKAAGGDGLASTYLKEVGDEIVIPLVKIFSKFSGGRGGSI